MNTLTLSNCMFNEDVVSGSLNNKVNGEINPPYLLDMIKFCANEEVHLGKISASTMSSRDKNNKDDTDDTSNNEVTHISHDPPNYNINPGMGVKSKWKVAPQLIISAAATNTQD